MSDKVLLKFLKYIRPENLHVGGPIDVPKVGNPCKATQTGGISNNKENREIIFNIVLCYFLHTGFI